MDFRRCLEVQLPYLQPVIGTYTDWTPLTDRARYFAEELDKDDPWQFANVYRALRTLRTGQARRPYSAASLIG